LALCLLFFKWIFFPSKVEVPRKFKLLAALLGFLIAITGAVSAQNLTTKRRIDFNASNEKRALCRNLNNSSINGGFRGGDFSVRSAA
jgi:hypothetical protein